MSWSDRVHAVIPAKAGIQGPPRAGSRWIPAFAGITGVARARVKVVAALALAAMTAGCFEPLYSETVHPGLIQAMREVDVAPIPDRVGHYLSDELISRLNGSGETPKPRYRLKVQVSTGIQTPTVESQIQAADSATVTGTATFVLTRIEGEKPIFSGSATSAAPYDRTLQSFADLRANRDAEIRVAKALADEIALRVAGALSNTQ